MSHYTKDLPQCSKKLPPHSGPKQYGLSPKVDSAMKRIETWSDDEKFELASELLKTFGSDGDKSKKLMNLARKMMEKSKTPTKEVCGQQSSVDPGASGGAAPATCVSMICRGDLVANSNLLFFDTEKVTIAQTHENKSGDMAIVDIKGRLLFWTYNHQENVCKFNTQLSGLDESKMEMGLSVEAVKEILIKLLDGKELWGASSGDDVKSLGFNGGIFPTSSATYDIQTFYRDFKGRAIGLGMLSEHFLGENVQTKTHSSITDARLTALCYRKMIQFKKIGMERFSCPLMDEIRSQPVKREQMRYDRCTCGKVLPGKKTKKRGSAKLGTPSEEFSAFHDIDFDDFMLTL